MLANVPENDSVPENVSTAGPSLTTSSTTPTTTTALTSARAVQPSEPSSSRRPVPDRALGAKRHKRNDGSAGVHSNDIIELTSDEEDTSRSLQPNLPPPSNQRPRKRLVNNHAPNAVQIKPALSGKTSGKQEVIVISDDEEPTAGASPHQGSSSSRVQPATRKSSTATKQRLSAPNAILIHNNESARPSVMAQPRTFSGIHSLSAGLRASASRGLTCSLFTVVRNRGDKGKRRASDEKEHDSGADSDETLC